LNWPHLASVDRVVGMMQDPGAAPGAAKLHRLRAVPREFSS
jgi:hypothetical protein